MKILVTGGAGFIGSHLIQYLHALNHEIIIFDKYAKNEITNFSIKDFEYIEGNIQDQLKLNDSVKHCNIIFHLAGILGTDYLVYYPELSVKINVLGTLNVLNLARETGAKVIYVSLIPSWNNSYMITKNAASSYTQMYHDEFYVKTIIAKVAHVYGPRQKWQPVKKAIPTFIMNALKGTPLTIYGSGQQLMDLIYVEDLVLALSRCMNEEAVIGKDIEIGSGTGIKVESLAKKIVNLSESKSKILHEQMRPGEPDIDDSFVPANTILQKKLLNFKPDTDLDTGLNKTINWYRDTYF